MGLICPLFIKAPSQKDKCLYKREAGGAMTADANAKLCARFEGGERDSELRSAALQGGKVQKVDSPRAPEGMRP